MAGIHADVLPFKCEHCEADEAERVQRQKESGQPLHDPSLREQWGCEHPTQVPVWEDEDEGELFFNCPVRFVSEAVVLQKTFHGIFKAQEQAG
jgi:hypothetical protein